MLSRFRFLLLRPSSLPLFLTNSIPSTLKPFTLFDQINKGASFFPRYQPRQLVHVSHHSSATASVSPYLSVTIQCRKCDAETLSEALFCFGANSVSMDEVSDFQDLDEVSITCIFPDCEDLHMCISQAVGSINLNYIPTYNVSEGEQCDWVKNVMDTFHPVEITNRLWIVPKWRIPPDLQATNIILDPGMAFGTGEHPTTKMCIILLQSLIRGGERFLDYGTGSGVLGIAAIKMGAALCFGIDIDSHAITAAHQNMVLNSIDSNKMFVYLVGSNSDAPLQEKAAETSNEETMYSTELEASKGTFDVVIANVLLNPLVELVDDIVSYAKPGGQVGLSGILSEQVQQIKEVYSPFLYDISVTEMEGWACVCGTRKENLDL